MSEYDDVSLEHLKNRVLELTTQMKLDRPLRVLHFGNIANNAYLAAKAERRVGIHAFVLSPEYHHVMGFPGWEESCFTLEESDHYAGDVYNEFTPHWFLDSFPDSTSLGNLLQDALDSVAYSRQTLVHQPSSAAILAKAYKRFRVPLLKKLPRTSQDYLANDFLFKFRRQRWAGHIARLFAQFDVVNAYGPYTAFVPPEVKALVATEHGTLRDFVSTKHPFALSSRNGYERSRAILVTNQDCLRPAEALAQVHQAKVFAMPHPTNPDEVLCTRGPNSLRGQLRIEESRHIVLAPARHSSSSSVDRGKGLDSLYDVIEAFHESGVACTFVLVRWGDQVDRVQRRLRHVEENGSLRWVDLMTRPQLQHLMSESAAVVDQFLIPAYGAIGMDALRLGTPLLTRSSGELDEAFFGTRAPAYAICSRDDLIDALLQILGSPVERAGNQRDGRSWFESHASWLHSLNARLKGYRAALGQ